MEDVLVIELPKWVLKSKSACDQYTSAAPQTILVLGFIAGEMNIFHTIQNVVFFYLSRERNYMIKMYL